MGGCEPSHASDDGLARAGVPFGGLGIDEHQAAHFLVDDLQTFVARPSGSHHFQPQLLDHLLLTGRHLAVPESRGLADCLQLLLLVVAGPFLHLPQLLVDLVLEGVVEPELAGAEVNRGQVGCRLLLEAGFAEFVGMADDAADGGAFVGNANEDGDLMFSLVDEALGAVERVDPDAQLLGLIEPLKLHYFGEGCHSF